MASAGSEGTTRAEESAHRKGTEWTELQSLATTNSCQDSPQGTEHLSLLLQRRRRGKQEVEEVEEVSQCSDDWSLARIGLIDEWR
jgi:hypothetical protein